MIMQRTVHRCTCDLAVLGAAILGMGAVTAPIHAQVPGAPSVGAGYTMTVHPNEKRGIWEGWGCSFAWWAHAVGGRKHGELYADLFFTDKTVPFLDKQLPGLNLNIIRYNVGGGGRRESYGDALEQVPDILPWHRDIDGY